MSRTHDARSHVFTHGVHVGLSEWLSFGPVKRSAVEYGRGYLGLALSRDGQDAYACGGRLEIVQLSGEFWVRGSVAVVVCAEVSDHFNRVGAGGLVPGFRTAAVGPRTCSFESFSCMFFCRRWVLTLSLSCMSWCTASVGVGPMPKSVMSST